MTKVNKLIYSLFILFSLFLFNSINVTAQECGTMIPGSCNQCDSHCYNWCKDQGKPDCVGPMADWENCCYQVGMSDNDSCDLVNKTCNCDNVTPDGSTTDINLPNFCHGPNQSIPPFYFCGDGFSNLCCDSIDSCQKLISPTPTRGPTPTLRPTSPPAPTPTPRTFTPYEAPSNAFFDMLNPLQHAGGGDIFEDEASAYANQLSTPGGIVSRVLAFAFPLAGLILFVMLVWGGFEILIQAPSKKGIDAGKQRVSAAIIGFILLFSSYWIWQIVEVVFGIVIF